MTYQEVTLSFPMDSERATVDLEAHVFRFVMPREEFRAWLTAAGGAALLDPLPAELQDALTGYGEG